MKITWYGHAAFLIETGGTRVILDPYRSPDSGGYLPIDEPADVVVVSHENDRYHSHLGQIRPPFEVIRALEIGREGAAFRDILFHAIRVFETPGRLPGDEVAMVRLQAEGLCVAFLGDLGHALTAEELTPLRGAEIVLVAAGGPPTIVLAEIPALLDAIGPRVVVPMHYKVEGKINLDIKPVEQFLKTVPGWTVQRVEGSSFEVKPDTLPARPTILWLQPAR